MADLRRHLSGTEVKIFDPHDASMNLAGAEVLDPTVVKRANQWWMYLAGQAHGYGSTDIYSASLPPEAPLSSTGWILTRTPAEDLQAVAPRNLSRPWDGKGGRHCPSFVKGMGCSKEAVGRAMREQRRIFGGHTRESLLSAASGIGLQHPNSSAEYRRLNDRRFHSGVPRFCGPATYQSLHLPSW